MILMYTGNIIGRQNILSCSQVNKLLDIRKKLGITSGGVPPCAACETNDRDIVTSDDIRPLEPVELLRAGQASHTLKGVTPLVKPGDTCPVRTDAAAGEKSGAETGGRTKEGLIAEVVRRVVEELEAGGAV